MKRKDILCEDCLKKIREYDRIYSKTKRKNKYNKRFPSGVIKYKNDKRYKRMLIEDKNGLPRIVYKLRKELH